MIPTPVLPAEVVKRYEPMPGSVQRVVVVTDAGENIRVRWHLHRPEPWRCDACGPMATADCAHTFAAGLVLAEEFFGLARIPSLYPKEQTA